MQSKFWAGGDFSESEFDSGESVLEAPEAKKPAAGLYRAASIHSDEEEHRVVRSFKNRRWDDMREVIKQMYNHMKIKDFVQLGKDYENLLKYIGKVTLLIEQEGPPSFFIRTVVEVEEYVEKQLKDKEGFKKLSKGRASALNTLRAKLRKSTELWQVYLDQCRKNPNDFLSAESEESDASVASSESDDYSEDELEGDSEGEAKSEKKVVAKLGSSQFDSDDESEWSDEEVAAISADENDRLASVMDIWGIKATLRDSGAVKGPKQRTKTTKDVKGKEGEKSEIALAAKDIESLFDTTDITAEAIQKRVQSVVEKRGRRGVDRSEQMNILKRMADIAKCVGQQCYVEVLAQLVTAEFDTTSGGHAGQSAEMWLNTYKNLEQILEILEIQPTVRLVDVSVSEEISEEPNERNPDKISTTIVSAFLERLDDELIKSLQLKDVHSDLYKVRLDTVASSAWELVKRRLKKCPQFISGEVQPSSVVEYLAEIISKYGEHREKVHAQLHLAYNKNLHDYYYEARDLLQIPSMHELCMQLDVRTQILYNRNLVQLGFCAFRKGLISEAHSYLSDICAQNRHKELLAQALSMVKNQEKTPEQERAERRRLLPYHLHINLDLVEGVHNICAMLLEVPHRAKNRYSSDFQISRQFSRMLEIYDSQSFQGPPENQREMIVAAMKALQKGDWKECSRHVFNLNIWDKFVNPDNVKEVLLNHIKREAMRTYIFSYLALYESFSVSQLSSMFLLQKGEVHSIVSKMMVYEEIHANWDETSQNIIINRVEPSRLQQLALSIAENISIAVEQNELTLNMKNPKFALSHDRRSPFQQHGDRQHGWGGRGYMETHGNLGTSGRGQRGYRVSKKGNANVNRNRREFNKSTAIKALPVM
ncbi:putative eukaryotic initiation factor-3, subunit 8 [Cardiosporidium cionae]|uniref:Eukaryotic translation initiation factor 3 subunit C n=1 Tax=Cardiosporidium cionae TaxID=476202 RepID=A0ABQ7JC47_9APIC|nr:putative eukaryotic initiation factor-3, subunit 8 [Cardiosporidium cionae]|eukprot:KAF8821578.1 putative eukaryotic initiation factor-3, subunit 8 [Cardiosporidium cionae]